MKHGTLGTRHRMQVIKVIQTERSRDFQNQREGRVLKFLFRGHNCWFRPEKWFPVRFCRTFVVSFALEFFQFNPQVCFHYARAWWIMWLTRIWRLSIRTVALHLRRFRTCQGFLREFQYTALQQDSTINLGNRDCEVLFVIFLWPFQTNGKAAEYQTKTYYYYF